MKLVIRVIMKNLRYIPGFVSGMSIGVLVNEFLFFMESSESVLFRLFTKFFWNIPFSMANFLKNSQFYLFVMFWWILLFWRNIEKSRHLVKVLVFIVIVVSFWIIKNIQYQNKLPQVQYLVESPGCWIPDMDPYDRSVKNFVSRGERMVCGPRPLVQSNQTSIWIDTDVLLDYNVVKLSDLSCCYTPFFGLQSKYYFYTECTEFNESAHIRHEFIKVTCKLLPTNKTYKDFHAFVVPKKKKKDYHYHEKNYDGLSVLIVGIDSVSKLNFHRQMPMTEALMKSLNAIEFFGHSRVDDNTFPNLMTVLTGHTVKEIKKICLPTFNDFFDDCPFIWNSFSEKNYFTAFSEDSYNLGIFNYEKKGFKLTPTDYFTYPYMAASQNYIGHSKKMNTYYCDGSRFQAEVLLDYAAKFVENMTLSKNKFWALFWQTSLTHDFVDMIENTDDIFFNFFMKMKHQDVLNRTVIFFFSDHGIRIGRFLKTIQGRMEANLPFLYILLPKWFQDTYKKAVSNMRRNTHMLTTHFDLHETMKDLLNTETIEDKNLTSRSTGKHLKKRGISLFLPISEKRSCESSEIGPMWCTCKKRRLISTKSERVGKAAEISVRQINSLLEDETKCSKLYLKTIIRAFETTFENKTVSYSDLIILFVTQPGLGEFEAAIRHWPKKEKMEVKGKIVRINLYGHQSKCIHNSEIELYCYCMRRVKPKNQTLTTAIST